MSVKLMPAPAYNAELVHFLRSSEPELWAWFGESSALADRRDDHAEVELLKSAYRIDGDTHDVVNGYATLLANHFAIGEPIAIYQQLGDSERNARVFRLNSQIHVVFAGDLLDILTGEEQHAVLAHELAHIALWQRDDGQFQILDHMLHRLASEPGASDAVVETTRRLRLHTEVWADAAAVDAVGSIEPVVTSIVKVNAGLRHVDADSYLRQAAQILEIDSSASEAWTHPELHIRVTCIEARKRGTAATTVAELVNGPDDLDRLDLLGQHRIQRLCERVLRSGSAALERSDAVNTYLASYPDLSPDTAEPIHADELAAHQPSIRWLAAAMLVDLGLSEGTTEDLTDLRRLGSEADRQGNGTEFDRILATATDRTPAEISRLRRDLL